MKHLNLIGLAIMGMICQYFNTGAQTFSIPHSSDIYKGYKYAGTGHNANVHYYFIPDIIVFVNSLGTGTAVSFADYAGGSQHYGYVSTCPQGDVQEVYEIDGALPVQRGDPGSQNNLTTYTYQPTASAVGNPIRIDAVMTGSGYACGDHSHSWPNESICSSTITVEQPGFISPNPIGNLCQNSPTIQLSDYFSGVSTSSLSNIFFLDDPTFASSPITFIDPSKLTAGQHKIYAFKHYDNGNFTAYIPFTIIASIPITFGPYPTSVCSNSGITNIQAFPKGGSWTGQGVDNNGNFDPSKVGAGTQDLTYSYIDPNKNTNPIGCTSSKTITITVKPPPTVNGGTFITVCQNDAPVILSDGLPSGGTWSGQGVLGNTFVPASVTPADYKLIYTVTDPNGCTNSATKIATVQALPVVKVGIDLTVCSNEPAFDLSKAATPAGGIFSGSGVLNNSFDPSVSGIGSFSIKYTYKDPQSGCSVTGARQITVKDIPKPIAPPNFNICLNANPILMQGAVPIGGIYTGDGIINGVFNPATAGLGSHTITYTYTDPNLGCSGYASFIVNVKSLPNVNAGARFSICTNAGLQQLLGYPSGGTWSGSGVVGNSFDPAKSGPGKFILTYSYNDPSLECMNTDTISATVFGLPQLSAGSDTTICQNSGLLQLKGEPTGGVWAGAGVFENNFDPSQVPVAVNVISYTYTNANGCQNSISKKITVQGFTAVSVGNPVTTCINSGPYNLINDANIQGGIWSGDGVNGGFFNPVIAKIGTHKLVYSYKNSNGCTTSAIKQMTVLNVPWNVTISGNLSGCNGTVVSLFAQADSATEYQWYHINDITPFAKGANLNYTISKSEKLYCVGVNQLGCGMPKLNAVTAQITSLTPSADLISSQSAIPFGGLVQFTVSNAYNILDYQWNFGDGGISTTKNPSHYYYQKGTFIVKVICTSPEGCNDTLQLKNAITVNSGDTVNVDPGKPRPTGIDTSPYFSKVYPSPFSDHFYIMCHLDHAQVINFRMYDTYGRILKNMDLNAVSGDNKFSIRDLSSLLIKNYYIIILRSDQLDNVIKILKM